MKALQLVAQGEPLELRDVPVPEPGEDQVRVKVAGCGVCHTDVGFWKDGVPTRKDLPLTLGHEIAGTVDAAGPGAETLVGREVIVPAVIPCGECDLCRAGRGNACQAQVMPGNDIDGGFAECVVVPARGLCPVDDLGGYDLADLSVVADAVTTPYQAIVRSGLGPGELAVVVGVGGVGTHAVQIARALGAHVVAIDVEPDRLAAVEDRGANVTLNASALDFRSIKAAVRKAAFEGGCPSTRWKIFECSGHPEGQTTAWGLLTHASTLMVVGFTLAKVGVRLSNLMALDATAQGTWGCLPDLYPDALRMVTDGRITLEPFVERHSLDEGAEILRRVADHELERRAILVPEA
ncbi:MAG: 6-hydroxycyclohex-1-ene-1-carbonyl-CoA dehydrogenase [Gemmatimonadota bacterium]|jgi:6-hydroxycyclohex-1-ene-1-carbonyl-CoA dehydrogenase